MVIAFLSSLILASLTPQQASAVVGDVAANVQSYYVIPEKRAAIVAAVRDAEKRGRYVTTDPAVLAERLTADLLAASNDLHMALLHDPNEYASLTAPAAEEDADAAAKALRYESDRARLRNSGIEELRILPGNVRYAKVTGFLWAGDESGRAIADATRFLRDGDAVIIDLRGNGGGAAVAVQHLISPFFDGPQLLMTFFNGASGESRQRWTVEHLPGGRMAGKPLFVLIDGGTGSAAEEFAYHVEQFKLGTLVGEKTAGAGHTTAHLPIAPTFVLRLSTGRPIHPVSKGNWEGTGVKPHVAQPSASALDAAHLKALEQLAAAAPDESARRRYAWGMAAVQGRLHPHVPSAADLAAYAGQYEGPRVVQVENGTLTYRRAGGQPVILRPLAADLFALGASESVRIRFVRTNGAVTAMEILYADRETTLAPRMP